MVGLGAFLVSVLILISPRRGTTSHDQAGLTGSADRVQTQDAQAPAAAHPAGRTESPPARPFAIPRTKEEAAPNASTVSSQDEQHEARVAARIAELENLSSKTDPASLETLLSEVRNPDHEIRQAALDALSQSGNRAVIPALREAAGQTEDAGAKQAILDVIEFISLPTLTEILSGNGATNNPKPPARP